MADANLVLRVIKNIVGLLGVVGNTAVVVLICKVQYLRTIADAFICNQAVVDCLGSLFLVLSSNVLAPDTLPNTSWYGFVCYFWRSGFILWACFTSSTVNLLALMLERYVAIVHPLRYAALFTKRSVVAIVAVVWLYGLVITGAYIAAVKTHRDGRCFSESSAVANALGIIHLLVKFFLPAAVMLFVFVHVTVTLRRRRTHANPTVPTLSAAQLRALRRARRDTLRTIFVVFLAFLFWWTPNQVIFFMSSFGWAVDFSGPVYVVSVALVATNSCINPIIYAFKYQRYRNTFYTLFRSDSIKGNQPSEPAETTTLFTLREFSAVHARS